MQSYYHIITLLIHGISLFQPPEDLLPDSSVRREVEAEIKAVYNTRYSCIDENITISINATGYGLLNPSHNRVYRKAHYDQYRNYIRSGYFYEQTYPTNFTIGPANGETNLTISAAQRGRNFTWDSRSEFFSYSGVLSEFGAKSKYLPSGDIIYSNMVYYHTYNSTRKLVNYYSNAPLQSYYHISPFRQNFDRFGKCWDFIFETISQMEVSCTYSPRPARKETVSISAYVVVDPGMRAPLKSYFPISTSQILNWLDLQQIIIHSEDWPGYRPLLQSMELHSDPLR